jgi:hypothetical protein
MPKRPSRHQAATVVPWSRETELLLQIDDRIPDDLPNQMRSNFARLCTMLFSEAYLKISSEKTRSD